MDEVDTTTFEVPQLLTFDEKILRERVQGDDRIFNELVEIFLADLPKRIEEIRSAVNEMNFAWIERAAHTLKGSAAVMGAQRLALATKELELSAQSRAHERVPEILAKMLEEFERLHQLLMLYHHEIKP